MADARTFPNVEFVNKSAEGLLEEYVAEMEQALGRTIGKADPLRVVAGWAASVDAQLYEVLNQTAKLNVPRFAFGDYLDSLAENFYHGLTRLEESSAQTTLRFTLSTESEKETPVPVGTRVTTADSVVFETTETKYIKAGELFVDVPAQCSVAGTLGNGYRPGEIDRPVDNDTVRNFQSVVNITASEGGSAEETDEAFYQRMRLSQGAYSTAGATDSYIYHAYSANPLVSGVRVVSPEKGVVEVYVMLRDSQIPGEEMLEEIRQYLSEDTRRPLTDCVTVKAPNAHGFQVEVVWYAEKNSGISRQSLEEAVELAVDEYIAWQTAQIGRDINPSYLIQLLMEAGVKRVEVRQPAYAKISDTEVAVLEHRTCGFGGEEDA